MKVYVDEMPKDWCECKFARVNNNVGNGHYCILRQGICPRLSEKTANEHKKLVNECCPLQSLADHDKEVRKQVCDEIRKFAYDTYKEFGIFDETDLEHILDQIEKGSDGYGK